MFSLLKSTTGAPRPRSSDTSPSHHGRAVAAILLESLFDAATSSAAYQPGYHNFSSHHHTPRLQPHRHLWPTHPRTSYTPRPPLQPVCDSTVHTAIAAYTPTTGIHLTAGVSTSATATPAYGRTRHSTTIDVPTQPTATTHRTWQHSPTPPVPDSWNPTEQHWGSNTLHGHQLHRTIQPTQWSRKAGVAGLPTFEVFPWQLAYHGTSEFTARTLSNGKYTGFIATRSIAESVFVTHFLQQLREKRLDLDGIAEALHTQQSTDIPNKTTHARAFHAPLIKLLIDQLQTHSPAPAEGTALRALKTTNDELARARQKLQDLGNPLTPVKSTSRSSAPAAPSHAPTPPPPKPPALTDVLQPPHPTLQDDIPEGWNHPEIQQWVTTFDPTIQEAAKDVVRLLQTSKVTTQQLKEAATKYGLPLNRVNRLPIRSLQQLVGVGAAIGC